MVRIAEVPHERALADPGLARDEHEAASAVLDGGQRGVQGLGELGALEQRRSGLGALLAPERRRAS